MDRTTKALNCDTIIDSLPPMDVGAEVARMEGRPPKAAYDAFLMLRTRKLPVLLEERGRQGMVALVAENGEIEGKYKLRFPREGKMAPGVLLVDTIRRKHAGQNTRCWFRYMAAWAGSETALLQFLVKRLRLGPLPLMGMVERENGWFYQFPEKPTENSMTLQDRVDELREEEARRRDQRIPHRRAVRWSCEAGGGTAVTVDVSRKGVHVLAKDRLPPEEGSEVQIVYPNRQGWINLYGTVVWSFQGGSGEGIGGFSMKIDRIEDGEGGGRWLRFVTDTGKTHNKARAAREK